MAPDPIVLLLGNVDRLADRIRALFGRLQRQSPILSRRLLGNLCEGAPYDGTSEKSRDEVWVTAKGDRLKIGEMPPEHLAHCLAMIMRKLRENPVEYRWGLDPETNQIKLYRKAPCGTLHS